MALYAQSLQPSLLPLHGELQPVCGSSSVTAHIIIIGTNAIKFVIDFNGRLIRVRDMDPTPAVSGDIVGGNDRSAMLHPIEAIGYYQ